MAGMIFKDIEGDSRDAAVIVTRELGLAFTRVTMQMRKECPP